MTGHFSFRGHLCIVNELLSINLYELIRNNGFHGFSTTLIRRFTVQILQSLSLLRHHRVVHCDLKPEVRASMSNCGEGADAPVKNILLKHPKRSAIKTIDFGSSCFEHEKGAFPVTLSKGAIVLKSGRDSIYLHPEPILPFA